MSFRRGQLRSRARAFLTAESGQAIISFTLLFAFLSLAGLALAIDFANLWFHRQNAQTAADAACQAGALDMLATTGGLQLNSMGFTPGTAGSCSSNPSATICAYAGFNGYTGAGGSGNSAWNTVSWTFPASVPGATAPPSSVVRTPYLKVTVLESVQTFFLSLFKASGYMQVQATCTCGLAQVKEAAPLVVLHPTMSGALRYSGGAIVRIVGGPQRSIQVNSTSATSVACSPSGYIDTSKAGPSATGGDIGVVSTELAAQNGCASSGGYKGFTGGTTGNWRSSVLPVSDPYAGLAAPVSVKTAGTVPLTYNATYGNFQWVGYGIDGCPDVNGEGAYAGNGVKTNCAEFGPGYYPNGLQMPDNYSTVIFLPGVYYINGSLSSGGSSTLRMALPCWSSYTSGYSSAACSPTAKTNHLIYSQGQGVFMYFTNSGTFSVSGGQSGGKIDPVPASALTCDGSAPPASLGMPTTLAGNVLWAQCTAGGTYYDTAGDTTDSAGSPGARGILFFEDHADTKSPSLSGSGQLAYAGSLYFHSNSYSDVLSLSGGTGTGSFILGNVVADQVSVSGSGVIGMQLNAVPSTYMLKATTFQ